jgi:hypothetical protein
MKSRTNSVVNILLLNKFKKNLAPLAPIPSVRAGGRGRRGPVPADEFHCKSSKGRKFTTTTCKLLQGHIRHSSHPCGCALVLARAAAQTRAPACDCRILSALEPRTARVVRSSRSAPPSAASSPHTRSACPYPGLAGSGCILRDRILLAQTDRQKGGHSAIRGQIGTAVARDCSTTGSDLRTWLDVRVRVRHSAAIGSVMSTAR